MDHYSGNDPAMGCAILGLCGACFVAGGVLVAMAYTFGMLAPVATVLIFVAIIGLVTASATRGTPG